MSHEVERSELVGAGYDVDPNPVVTIPAVADDEGAAVIDVWAFLPDATDTVPWPLTDDERAETYDPQEGVA